MATNRYYTAHRDHGAIRIRRGRRLSEEPSRSAKPSTHECRSLSRNFSCNCA